MSWMTAEAVEPVPVSVTLKSPVVVMLALSLTSTEPTLLLPWAMSNQPLEETSEPELATTTAPVELVASAM